MGCACRACNGADADFDEATHNAVGQVYAKAKCAPGSASWSPEEIGELRAKKPDLYVNLTTGTYPSPFWLLYADSIWRGGDDHSFAGVGSR